MSHPPLPLIDPVEPREEAKEVGKSELGCAINRSDQTYGSCRI